MAAAQPLTRGPPLLLLPLLLLFSGAAAASLPAPDASDLRRAATRVPRPALRGATAAQVAARMNAATAAGGLPTVPCEDLGLVALADVLLAIDARRDSGLAELYRIRGDPRGFVYTSRAALRYRLELEGAAANSSEALRGTVAATRCRLAVLWYTHHLSAGARRALAAARPLPLMPAAAPALPAAGASPGGDDVRRWHAEANACSACHYDGGNGPGTTAAPAPARDDPPAPLASNVNYTIYGGPTGCCSPERNWTQMRKIDRRFDHSPPQHLEWNEVCDDGEGEPGTCCILDDCAADPGHAMRQYQGCHFLFNGTDLWEWYPDLRRCAKLLSGAGGVVDVWPTAGRPGSTYLGSDTMGDVPDVAQRRTCGRYDTRGRVPWPGRGGCVTQPYNCVWQRDDGTPCKQRFPNGVDEYADWVETPELTGGFALPSYCPAQDSPAVLPYPTEFGAQAWVCTRCWLKGTCPTGGA